MNIENTLYAGLPVLEIFEFQKETIFEEGGVETELFISNTLGSFMTERACFEAVIINQGLLTRPEDFSDESLELICLDNDIYIKFIDG